MFQLIKRRIFLSRVTEEDIATENTQSLRQEMTKSDRHREISNV